MAASKDTWTTLLVIIIVVVLAMVFLVITGQAKELGRGAYNAIISGINAITAGRPGWLK